MIRRAARTITRRDLPASSRSTCGHSASVTTSPATSPTMDSSGKAGPSVVARAAVGGPSSNLPDFTSTNIGSNPEKIDDFGIDSTLADTGADLNPTTGVIRIRGGGHDIWDQADDLTFTHQ